MESLSLIERLDKAVKRDIQNLQEEVNDANTRCQKLASENDDITNLNKELTQKYDRVTLKLQTLEEEITLLNNKMTRKQEELKRKEKWWGKYYFTAERIIKQLRTHGSFPEDLPSELLAKDPMDMMNEGDSMICGGSQDSEGKKSIKLSMSKINRRTRYSDVSPEGRNSQSSQENQKTSQKGKRSPVEFAIPARTHSTRLSSSSIAMSSNNNIVMESRDGSSQQSQKTSTSSFKNLGKGVLIIESNGWREEKVGSHFSSRSVTNVKSTASHKPAMISSFDPESATMDVDDYAGLITSTPMVHDHPTKVPTPAIHMPDLSIINEEGSSRHNTVKQQEHLKVANSLPVSDSQFTIDLTHTQPPSPTIPSKSESVFREADSSDTLRSPGVGKHGNRGSTAGNHGNNSGSNQGNKSSGSQSDDSSKSQKTRRSKLNFQSSQKRTSQMQKLNDMNNVDLMDFNPRDGRTDKSVLTGLEGGKDKQGTATVRNLEGKVHLERLEQNNRDVPSPSILQSGPLKSMRSRDWQEESTVMYPGKGVQPQPVGKGRVEMIDLSSDNSLRFDDGDNGSTVGTGKTSDAQKYPVGVGDKGDAQQGPVDRVFVGGVKRKRTGSDEREKLKSSKIQNQAPEVFKSASSNNNVFKVPSGPVHVSGPDQADGSVVLLSDGEADGRLEISCQDMFADSVAEPSRDNFHVSGSSATRETSDHKDTSTHDIKTSTPLSSAPRKEPMFDWTDMTKEEEEFHGPRKPKDLGYKNIEVVRKKDDRAKLNGFSCRECEKYYGSLNLPEEELQKRLKACSRHRAKYSPPPSTPPGFWNLSFPETQEYMAKGCLETGNEPPPQASRYRRLKSRKKRPVQQ